MSFGTLRQDAKGFKLIQCRKTRASTMLNEGNMDSFFRFCFIFVNGLCLVFMLLRMNEPTILSIIGTIAVFVWLVIVSLVLTEDGLK